MEWGKDAARQEIALCIFRTATYKILHNQWSQLHNLHFEIRGYDLMH